MPAQAPSSLGGVGVAGETGSLSWGVGGPPAARNQEGSVQAASGRLGFLIPSPAGPRAWDMAKPLPGPTGRPQVLSMRSSSPDPRD